MNRNSRCGSLPADLSTRYFDNPVRADWGVFGRPCLCRPARLSARRWPGHHGGAVRRGDSLPSPDAGRFDPGHPGRGDDRE